MESKHGVESLTRQATKTIAKLPRKLRLPPAPARPSSKGATHPPGRYRGQTIEIHQKYTRGTPEVHRRYTGGTPDTGRVNPGPSPYLRAIIPPCTRTASAFPHSNLPQAHRLPHSLIHQLTNSLTAFSSNLAPIIAAPALEETPPNPRDVSEVHRRCIGSVSEIYRTNTLSTPDHPHTFPPSSRPVHVLPPPSSRSSPGLNLSLPRERE
jgi:hypothetical protein